jgi:hypothetical protein
MEKWVALVQDGNGKITRFEKYTDNGDLFESEVKTWDKGYILAIFRVLDVIETITL